MSLRAGNGCRVRVVAVIVAGLGVAASEAPLGAQTLRTRTGDPWCETHNGRPWLQRSCEVRDFVTPASDIELDAGHNGTVDVRQWDRPDILVSVRVEAQAASPEAALRLQRRITVDVEKGRIRPLIPALDEDEWASTSVRLYVPRQTDLSITTFNGDIRITGVEGTISLRSRNGRFDLADVGGDVRGRTTNGEIVLLLGGDSWRGRGAHLATTDGGVTLLVPQRYAADLEVTTLTGGFSIEDLPLDCNPPGGGCSSRRVLESLNGGGARLRIETSTGGVHVRPRH